MVPCEKFFERQLVLRGDLIKNGLLTLRDDTLCRFGNYVCMFQGPPSCKSHSTSFLPIIRASTLSVNSQSLLYSLHFSDGVF